jgi:hypothetical protein
MKPTIRKPCEGCTIAVVGDVYRFLIELKVKELIATL